MREIFLKFLFIGIFATSVFAQNGTKIEKVKVVSGYGLTKTQAIQNALIEATKQQNGAIIQSVKSVFKTYAQQSTSNNGENSYQTLMQDGVAQKIRVATKGYIDKYEIVDIIEHPSDFEAKIKVTTVEYKTPGHSVHKRRKIVVIPSYTDSIMYRVLNGYKSAKEISVSLNQELISSLTQTRKFSILDRENNHAYNLEKDVILSADAHKDELLKLGNVVGADYLIISDITDFKILNKTTTVLEQKITKLKAIATIKYRIIAMATRQIKWSNTKTFEFTPKGKTTEQVFINVLKQISEALTYEIIENIYPIKIADISANGNVILNQSLKLNSIYEVYALGNKLFDSYTKEFLGYDEIHTGTIQVIRSLPKVSYAKIIKGDAQKGSICRKSKNKVKKQKNNQQSTSNNTISNGKKYIAIKKLSISSNIDKYKHRYIKNANIDVKIKDLVNKSNKYRVLSRDPQQIKELMQERQIAQSDISDDTDEDTMRLALTDYQLLPKITKFKIYRSSKKLPNIDIYENTDYINMELSISLINRKGEVEFESTKSRTYSKKWTSAHKAKGAPSSTAINKIANKLVSEVLYDLLNEKAQMLSKKFITVVEVGKKTIYLDLGDNQDIQEGDIYPVYKEPVVKTIQRTGKTRLSYGERIAKVKIDAIFDDGAEAVVVSGRIKDIKEGYILRLHKRKGK